MDTALYLNIFQKASDQVGQTDSAQNKLNLKVGIWLDSVVLKIQRPAWQNPNRKPFDGGIFFSVWVSEDTIHRGKIYYNIHALKLRELSAYKLQSREFAEAFRTRFRPFEQDWPNVSSAFGPLTLMEGWVGLDINNADVVVRDLAVRFFGIAHLIDNLLAARKE